MRSKHMNSQLKRSIYQVEHSIIDLKAFLKGDCCRCLIIELFIPGKICKSELTCQTFDIRFEHSI